MTTRRGWVVMIAAVTIALALPARRPVAQDAGDVFPFPVRMTELGNGLKVVSVEYDSPEIMAFYTIVRTGSRNEVEDGFSGYAHFFEHIMTLGKKCQRHCGYARLFYTRLLRKHHL